MVDQNDCINASETGSMSQQDTSEEDESSTKKEEP